MEITGNKLRIELFSDAVIAIVITIAALEIPIPQVGDYSGFFESLLTFAISFFIVAGYWNDHRKLFEQIKKINEPFVIRNTCFLFSLVLIPVFTSWSMTAVDKPLPTIAYGVLLMVINATFSSLFKKGIPLVMKGKEDQEQLKQLYAIRDRIYYLAIFLVMLIGWFIPQVALVLFIGVPIISYFLKSNVEESVGRKNRNRRHMSRKIRKSRKN
ncbi:TMEM175 family protein [Enterococcus wangshanyuanii]|uniref:Membrane protein n=1 Tax=Enterococcus wangshanyuanii TaxID=2005703 RepID=A0ABQ1PPY7_9ENTE|nr:TMEM175 family protein [Enterococcus wangshanyuanii]GGD00800.1 membrane protein [Enterococcus wangshanyuanii]